MSKPTLEGNNSRAIAAYETGKTRQIQQVSIQALAASKQGDKQRTESLVIEAMQYIADVDQIADLVQHGRYKEALALIDQQLLKETNK